MQPNVQQLNDIIASQIGKLFIENTALKLQVQALTEQLAEATKKKEEVNGND